MWPGSVVDARDGCWADAVSAISPARLRVCRRRSSSRLYFSSVGDVSVSGKNVRPADGLLARLCLVMGVAML